MPVKTDSAFPRSFDQLIFAHTCHHGRGDVDDASELAFFHCGIDRTDEYQRRDHISIKRFGPSVLRKSRTFPGLGLALLFTRISGTGHASRSLACPSVVVTSATTGVTFPQAKRRIYVAAFSNRSALRPLMKRLTSSCAKASARANPNPRPDAQTIMAYLSIAKSIVYTLLVAN